MISFDMTHTALEGTIPNNIEQIWPNLNDFVVGFNFLSGEWFVFSCFDGIVLTAAQQERYRQA